MRNFWRRKLWLTSLKNVLTVRIVKLINFLALETISMKNVYMIHCLVIVLWQKKGGMIYKEKDWDHLGNHLIASQFANCDCFWKTANQNYQFPRKLRINFNFIWLFGIFPSLSFSLLLPTSWGCTYIKHAPGKLMRSFTWITWGLILCLFCLLILYFIFILQCFMCSVNNFL